MEMYCLTVWEIRVLAGLVLPEDCEEESIACLSPSLWWFAGHFGIPWFVEASLQPLPQPSRVLLSMLSGPTRPLVISTPVIAN